jgi:GNAT superfamily N-acetyltransferase
MELDRPSLRSDAASVYGEHRAEYLAQLVAPMDDMWAVFADMAAPHALMVGEQIAGSCCVDDERQLLRFFVLPRFSHRAEELLRLALSELQIERMVVSTLDPGYLAAALDVADGFEVHALLYRHVEEPTLPGLDGLVAGRAGDQERIVDFQAAAIGAPRSFLESYVHGKLERQEMLLYEQGSQLLCVGELRRDDQQPGIAQLGLIVSEESRGQGIGSRMMTSLVARSRDEGLAPHCSTEATNVGARRAIERAGFRATHRLLFLPV